MKWRIILKFVAVINNRHIKTATFYTFFCSEMFILVHSKPKATSSLLRNHWEIPLSNQTYITYTTTKEVTLIPSRHTLLLVNTPTPRMSILIHSRTHNTSQQTHKVSFNRYKDYTCYRIKSKINTRENPISHTLIKLNL